VLLLIELNARWVYIVKNKYLIVLDLDGTTLTKSKKIPFLTRRYLRYINKNVCPIVLASGRPARSVRVFHKQLGLTTPIISLNGLHIHYSNNPELDKRVFLDPKNIVSITNDVAKHFPINNVICETDKHIYITNKDGWLDRNFWLLNMTVKYGTLEDNLKNKVMTHIIELKDSDINDNELEKIFDKHPHFLARRWTGKFNHFVEVYDDINNKYKSIKELAHDMNVKLENVIAFGDDRNDVDMLKYLPNAYAMKNSLDSIKAIAHHVTKYDNEHQGVKKELKRILKELE